MEYYMKRNSLYTLILLIGSNFIAALVEAAKKEDPYPNIIYYIADDLGTGDVNQDDNGFTTPNFKPSHVISTPHLKKLASKGMRFQEFWGASVCGPGRRALLTGMTIDTSPVRGNGLETEGNYVTLPNMTLPLALHQLGYATGCVGKYALGDPGTKSSAWNMGFKELFYGYGKHVDAHDPFPLWLWNNTHKIQLPINKMASKNRCLKNKCISATKLFREQALNFITAYAEQRFFLYWATISPHVGMWNVKDKKSAYPVSSYGKFANQKWPEDRKGYASMVTNMDDDIGLLSETLNKLQLENKTIIIFSSDNNAERQYTNGKPSVPTFFQSTGGDRGYKRTMYRGGIRIPGIAVWPGHIPANTNSYYPFSLADISKTLLTLIKAPQNILDQFPDSKITRAGGTVSVAPLWLRGDKSAYNEIPRDWLSSEYCEPNREGSCLFAFLNVRNGLKLLTASPNRHEELYNISADPQEKNNLAADPQYATAITSMRKLRNSSRTPLLN